MHRFCLEMKPVLLIVACFRKTLQTHHLVQNRGVFQLIIQTILTLGRWPSFVSGHIASSHIASYGAMNQRQFDILKGFWLTLFSSLPHLLLISSPSPLHLLILSLSSSSSLSFLLTPSSYSPHLLLISESETESETQGLKDSETQRLKDSEVQRV